MKYVDNTLAALLAVSLVAAGCEGKKPKPGPFVVLSGDPSAPFEQATAPVSFGNVAVLTGSAKIVTIANTGNRAAVLGEVSGAALGLAAPYELEDAPASLPEGVEPCQSGMVLAPDELCGLRIGFAPTVVGLANDEIKVLYAQKPKDPAAEIALDAWREAKLKLTGTGILDCSLNPDMAASKDEGIADANAKNAENTAKGKAAGEALTYDDGKSDGYSAGYSAGYKQGYDSSQGYPKGQSEGFSAGFNLGYQDSVSCSEGSKDGTTKGFNDGRADGEYDGYLDGYDDGFVIADSNGYADGYDDGYFSGRTTGISAGGNAAYGEGYDLGWTAGDSQGYSDGYDDGFYSCDSGWSDDEWGKIIGPVPQTYLDQCYDQGYDQTFDPNAYKKAFDAAKAKNVAYQSGYTDGFSAGKTAGIPVGTNEGYEQGFKDGRAAGILAGKSAVYQDCYEAAYPSAYSNGYNVGYDDAYGDGYVDGSLDGYDVGYDDGFDAGYSDGYWDGYDLGYTNLAYNDGYDAGFNDGYYAGYDDGFDDGYAYCASFQPVRLTSSLKASRDARVGPSEVGLRPVPGVDSSKRKARARERALSRAHFGKGRQWFRADTKAVIESSSKLPPLLADAWSVEQVEAWAGQRSSVDETSLRSVLRQEQLRKRTVPRKAPKPGSRPKGIKHKR